MLVRPLKSTRCLEDLRAERPSFRSFAMLQNCYVCLLLRNKTGTCHVQGHGSLIGSTLFQRSAGSQAAAIRPDLAYGG